MSNYKDLPQQLSKTRNQSAVSELVDLKVYDATEVEVEQVSKEDYTFVPLTDENAIGKDEMIYNYLRSKEVKAILKAAKKKKK